MTKSTKLTTVVKIKRMVAFVVDQVSEGFVYLYVCLSVHNFDPICMKLGKLTDCENVTGKFMSQN